MKLTNLSKGGTDVYHFPPCHILDLCGFHILLECPLDLSTLTTLFSPIQTQTLIQPSPRFKTLTNLHLWGDPSLIDAVLVSSPAAMLGLPFLSRSPNFSAKIYATEPTAKIGRMFMEDLVSMNGEFVRFCGPENGEVREIVAGEAGEELGSYWIPFYSAEDIKECMQRVKSVKYAEEVCFNGALLLKAYSSGLEIGSCNWSINGPRRSITYLASSIFQSAHAMDFDYHSLQGNDVVLFSDFSFLYSSDVDQKNERESNNDDEGERGSCLIDSIESSEETNKINFICSCVMDSLNEGGSVLIPIGRLGTVLLLLEHISDLLQLSNLEVPIFMISSIAKEMLAFTNAVPEWLCKKRQEKLFSGEPLFSHVELMRERKLHLFPELHSSELLLMWQEPCIVFSPHWSLRLGPAVHFLYRWHADSRCLLILEQGIDAEAALMPFKTVEIKVLQCSFLSGMKVDAIKPLLEILQPKLVLFPEDLKSQYLITTANNREDNQKYSFLYYSENRTVRVPNFRENYEAYMATDLALQLCPKKVKEMAVARLKGGKLLLRNGKYYLVSTQEKLMVDPPNRPAQLYWGRVDPARLLLALKEKGLNGSLVFPEDGGIAASDNSDITYSILLSGKEEDVIIKINKTQTEICCSDEGIVARICEAFSTVCDDNARDSFYRASVNFVLSVCSRVTQPAGTVQIDGEKPTKFISGLADNIGLESIRAARIICAAVAAWTRSCFLQAWALEVQGKRSEVLEEMSKICLIFGIFPPEEYSPEMEMVASGLKKTLQVEQRKHLLTLFMEACSSKCKRTAEDALGLIYHDGHEGSDVRLLSGKIHQ